MKFLLALAALFCAPAHGAALGASDPQLVRMLDGHAYNCDQVWETGKTAYFPKVKSLTADDTGISVDLDVSFSLCVSGDHSLQWAARGPLDPINTKDAAGNPIRTEFRNPELGLGDETLARIQVVSLAAAAEQTVSFHFQPADLLSDSDLAALASGKAVRVTLTLFQRSVGTAYTQGQTIPLGYQSGGEYTLSFTLRK